MPGEGRGDARGAVPGRPAHALKKKIQIGFLRNPFGDTSAGLRSGGIGRPGRVRDWFEVTLVGGYLATERLSGDNFLSLLNVRVFKIVLQ